jgi:hypothetical protein
VEPSLTVSHALVWSRCIQVCEEQHELHAVQMTIRRLGALRYAVGIFLPARTVPLGKNRCSPVIVPL